MKNENKTMFKLIDGYMYLQEFYSYITLYQKAKKNANVFAFLPLIISLISYVITGNYLIDTNLLVISSVGYFFGIILLRKNMKQKKKGFSVAETYKSNYYKIVPISVFLGRYFELFTLIIIPILLNNLILAILVDLIFIMTTFLIKYKNNLVDNSFKKLFFENTVEQLIFMSLGLSLFYNRTSVILDFNIFVSGILSFILLVFGFIIFKKTKSVRFRSSTLDKLLTTLHLDNSFLRPLNYVPKEELEAIEREKELERIKKEERLKARKENIALSKKKFKEEMIREREFIKQVDLKRNNGFIGETKEQERERNLESNLDTDDVKVNRTNIRR